MFNKKILEFHRISSYKKIEKTPIEFLIDEIDFDSSLFQKFLNVFIVQNIVLRLSKRLIRKT